jgi:bifunctional UDP-N-acetylglucosamine pyrophosphorylase / glucosamine-1-phosphate N-acetyltransferase
MNPFSPEHFFDLDGSPAARLFQGLQYVWEGVEALPRFIEQILQPVILGEVEEGAWLEPGRVQIGEGSRVERGAIIRGPSIICRNTVVRSGAYLRGHVFVGDDCIIGWGTELRQVLVLNKSKLPHQNLFFTSLVGNRVQVGGTTHTANFLLSGKEISVRVPLQGQLQSFPTGLTLFGAVIGDDFKIGALCLLQPGTIISQRCQVYPQCSVSGYLPPDSLVKPKSTPFEVISRSHEDSAL